MSTYCAFHEWRHQRKGSFRLLEKNEELGQCSKEKEYNYNTDYLEMSKNKRFSHLKGMLWGFHGPRWGSENP